MTSSLHKTAVVLSTYEGEKFLPELLDSLKEQKISFVLFWRDDNSRDNSANIVRDYSGIKKVECNEILGNIGPAKSFLHLLSHVVGFDYVAFCDQDDVWDSDKLEVAIKKLSDSFEIPSIYASKVRILNSKLTWPSEVPSLSTVNALFENVILGCTLVMNRRAIEILRLTPPPDGILHDEWIYLLGIEFMDVTYDAIPHISYRLHKDNATGIDSISTKIFLKTVKRLSRLNRVRSKSKIKIHGLRYVYATLNVELRLSKDFDEVLCKKRLCRISKVGNLRFRQDEIENLAFKILWLIKYF